MLQLQLISTFYKFNISAKRVLYSERRLYNHLPLNITILSNDVKHFKSTLKSYIIEHSIVCMNIINQHPNDYGSFI